MGPNINNSPVGQVS